MHQDTMFSYPHPLTQRVVIHIYTPFHKEISILVSPFRKSRSVTSTLIKDKRLSSLRSRYKTQTLSLYTLNSYFKSDTRIVITPFQFIRSSHPLQQGTLSNKHPTIKVENGVLLSPYFANPQNSISNLRIFKGIFFINTRYPYLVIEVIANPCMFAIPYCNLNMNIKLPFFAHSNTPFYKYCGICMIFRNTLPFKVGYSATPTTTSLTSLYKTPSPYQEYNLL